MKVSTSAKNILLFPFNLLYKINPELDLKILFKLKLGYKLNLNAPKTFNEKLQWIKLYDKNPLMSKCVDKYTVREYVRDKGYEKNLNELLWEGFDPSQIPFDTLPQKFVIKVTHGSTYNIIVTDKNKLDKKETIKSLKKWLNEKFIPCYGEWFYGIEKPRVIIEKYIDSDNEHGLLDYKFFCFNGKVKCIYVSTSKIYDDHYCIDYYDENWELLPLKRTGHKSMGQMPKPKKFDEMKKIAEDLSKNFHHARIDFFYEKDQIIFGEITFTTSAGFGKIEPFEFDEKMGSWLKLPIKKVIQPIKTKVLMVGPARNVKGGMTTVVDNLLKSNISTIYKIEYIESINDKNNILKFLKEIIGKIHFLFRIKKSDIVHIHMASRRSTFRKCWYIKLAKRFNKKVLLHIHGGAFKQFYEKECNDKQRKYIKTIINKCDKVIVLSADWKDYFKKIIDVNKISVIPNGIVIPSKFNKDFNYNIIYLGRINKDKGIYDLLNAVSILKEKYPDIKLLIAGTGDSLELCINKLNLNDNVQLLGWINEKQKIILLKECFFFCLPSYYEAMPMSLLEAMSYGCVSIASDVGSIPEVIDNNVNGILIKAGNINDLCNKFIALFDDYDKSINISKNAIETSREKFDFNNSISMVIEIYEDVMK